MFGVEGEAFCSRNSQAVITTDSENSTSSTYSSSWECRIVCANSTTGSGRPIAAGSLSPDLASQFASSRVAKQAGD
uniref:Uncharacterized protein n=1 Tax=Arundo donax TaxID=35708 RepID=A0A0A9D6P2_ARUDO